MTDKLTVIPGAEDELRAEIEELKRRLPILAEISKQIAAARKLSFDAHIEAGFSEDQALKLCENILL
ncbi:MAG: hypothetical protein ROR55_19685 [Devosia sp.]